MGGFAGVVIVTRAIIRAIAFIFSSDRFTDAVVIAGAILGAVKHFIWEIAFAIGVTGTVVRAIGDGFSYEGIAEVIIIAGFQDTI